jgi:Flp pilus assembly protein TadG
LTGTPVAAEQAIASRDALKGVPVMTRRRAKELPVTRKKVPVRRVKLPRIADSKTPRPPGARDVRRHSGLASERGQALLETAVTLPLILLVSVSIFEFGRAYQTVQVLTNATREGARVAVLPNATPADVQARVTAYLQAGQLPNAADAIVNVNQNVVMPIGATTAAASLVSVNYPFSFMVLNSVANLVVSGSALGGAPLTLSASTEMRNEAQ